MKNHISFCVNNSKRLTFCFVNELQDVLRFLAACMIHSFLFHFSNPFLSWEEVLVEVCTWNSTSLRSAYSICMRISRARIYNNVPPSPSFHPPFQNYVLQHSYQSAIYEIVSKKFRKKDRYVWSEWIYRLLLHPLSERR